MLAQADKVVLSVLIEDIRLDFGLSDTQIGLLSGLAFSAFYAIMGLPLARWCDLGNRRVIMAVCLGLWSLMTALSGYAQSFAHLFIARIGLGVGEAGAQPTGNSLAAEYYPVDQRGKVATVVMLSSFFGSVVGMTLGGMALAAFGWRSTLFIMGVPGMLIALLVYTTLREPRTSPQPISLRNVFDAGAKDALLAGFRKPAFIHVLIGTMAYGFFLNGAGVFHVPLYIRAFGMAAEDVGAVLGPILGVSGLCGAIIAATTVDRLARRDVRWLLRLPALFSLSAAPFLLVAYNTESATASFSVLFVGVTLMAAMVPGLLAAIYGISGKENRGMAMAILGFFMSFFGMGLGPIITGVLSDWLTPQYGAAGLRYSLSIVVLLLLWVSAHLFYGSRTLAEDFEDPRPDVDTVGSAA